ncbi:hypothetical protein O8I39_07620 [Campylobacter lari]
MSFCNSEEISAVSFGVIFPRSFIESSNFFSIFFISSKEFFAS